MTIWSYIIMFVGFTVLYLITSPNEDDDGPPDGGMMQPVYQGSR